MGDMMISKTEEQIYVTVLKQLGIHRQITATEKSFIDIWRNTYSFNKEIIMEACKRAVVANPHFASFNYVNAILESWHKRNIHTIADIEKLDRK